MYNATVLRHYREPRNVGKIENTHGVGIYMNDFCGDITKVWTKVAEGKIVDAKYKTQGCAASIACGNVLQNLSRIRLSKRLYESRKMT